MCHKSMFNNWKSFFKVLVIWKTIILHSLMLSNTGNGDKKQLERPTWVACECSLCSVPTWTPTRCFCSSRSCVITRSLPVVTCRFSVVSSSFCPVSSNSFDVSANSRFVSSNSSLTCVNVQQSHVSVNISCQSVQYTTQPLTCSVR